MSTTRKAGSSLRHLPLTGGALTGALTVPDGTEAAPGLRVTTHNHGLMDYSAIALGVIVNGTLNAIAMFGGWFGLADGLFGWIGRSILSSPADGKLKVTNAAADAGVMLDVTADGVLSARNRGDTGPAAIRSSQGIEMRSTDKGLTLGESGLLLVASAAAAQIVVTLPTAVAGAHYWLAVDDTDGIKIVAAAGDAIYIGASGTAAAGYIRCATVGAWVHLVAFNDSSWCAVGHLGTWTFDS